MARAEGFGVDRAQFGVVTATSLADVVVETGEIDQLRLGQLVDELAGQGEFLRQLGPFQLAQVLDQVEGVRVHRIDVEQVVLHLSDDLTEFRQVQAENAVAVHPPQVAVDAFLALEQLDEQAGVADVVAEVVVDQVAAVAQQADGVGAYALDGGVLRQQHEDFHQRERRALEHVRVSDFQVAVAQLEAGVQRLDLPALASAQDHFLEVLHDQVVEFRDRHHRPVVLLHEQLDRQLGVVAFIAEQAGDTPLVIEQQAVLGAPGEHVQGVADLPEEFLAGGQRAALAFHQEAFLDQRVQVEAAEMSPGDPEQGLQVAQTTRRALDVGLQVVLGVVVLGVAVDLLLALGQVELAARPHVLGAGGFEHALAQAVRAGDGPALHQVGDHREIGLCFFRALVDRADTLADFQADVPEQGKEAFDRVAEGFLIFAIEQDQDVDVGMRVQLAATVAADGDQSDIGVVAPVEALPGLLQDLVDEPGAVFDQAADIAAAVEAGVEHLIGLANGLLEGSDGAGLEGQFRLELPTVEQFGIHLGHGGLPVGY
ncbi:hypothetical protein D3C76_669130 [compost metagenome]